LSSHPRTRYTKRDSSTRLTLGLDPKSNPSSTQVTTLALIAVLASAALHAAWNALLKRTADQAAASVVLSAGAALCSVILALVVGPATIPAGSTPYLLAAGLVEGLYFATLSQSLRLLPLGTAYGLSRGAGLLLIWPFSIALFAEPLTAPTLAGALLLSLGLFLLITRAGSRLGLVMAALCALTIAAYPLAYKQALVHGVAPFSLFAISLAISLPVQLVFVGRGRAVRLLTVMRAAPARLALAALICAASFLLYLFALCTSGPGRMTGLRNTSVLFVALIAWASGERPTRRDLASAATIALGAVLLSA